MKAKAKVNQQRAGGSDQQSASQSAANEAAGPVPDFKVIYTARTHKQLSQAMGEMKRTEYAKKLTAVCLASRNEYCLNEDVRQLSTLTEKNQSCAEKRRCRSLDYCCKYFRPPKAGQQIGDYSDMISSLQSVSLNEEVPVRGAVIDVENMIEAGSSKKGCAYYAAQFAAGTEHEAGFADVVFAPYNYIFNPAVTLSVRNTVIIFDEGHNIEQTCEDAGSAGISTFTLKQCSSGLNKLADDDRPHITSLMQNYSHLDVDSLKTIADFADALADAITNRAKAEESQNHSQTTTDICKPPIAWFTGLVMGKLSLGEEVDTKTGETSTEMLGTQREVMREISLFLSDSGYEISSDGKIDSIKNFLSALTALSDFLQNIFPESQSPNSDRAKDRAQHLSFMKNNYRVAISKDFPRPSGYKLNLFCLNPGVAIERLLRLGVRSIIITSGTLAPMNSFESELGIQFRHKLCNPHVIPADQLMIFSVRQHAEFVLDGSFRATQFGTDYYKNIGLALTEYVKRIPKGVLIFFKSYSCLNKSLDIWRRNGTFRGIDQQKKVFEEPRDKRDFKRVLDAYKQHIDNGSGALLVAVFRGKISEGLDLADDYCRGVIVIGLPFPNWADPHVQLKREYLDAKKDVRLSKDKWYNNQMLRAVNQAVGRVVRHRHDYGVVILMDCSYNAHLKGLSAWLQDFIRKQEEFNAQTFAAFFRANVTRTKSSFPVFLQPPAKRSEPLAVISISDDEDADCGRQPLAAKRMKLNLPVKTIPVRTDASNPLSDFMTESWNELKNILQKEKVSQLLVIMREMRDTRSVANFTAGVQKTFFGLPRVKTAKHIRGEPLHVKELNVILYYCPLHRHFADAGSERQALIPEEVRHLRVYLKHAPSTPSCKVIVCL